MNLHEAQATMRPWTRSPQVVMLITIPGEPAVKARPRLGKHGNTYTPPATVKAEADIGWRIRDEFPGMVPEPDIHLGIDLVFRLRTRGRRDIDNMTKLVFDALNGVVWKDDSQVIELHASTQWVTDNPGTDIVVYVPSRRGAA